MPSAEPSLYHNNRAFCYGDALFETIHANGTALQLFAYHYKRLMNGMDLLGMDKKSLPSKDKLESDIIRLLNKNHLYSGVRVRLSVFRNYGGFYTPADNSVSYLAETTPLPAGLYELNEKGFKTGTYDEMKKQPSALANMKTANSILYIRAGMFAREKGLDDCLIKNTTGNLAETTSSNIFIIRNGNLYTPSLEQGCVAGVMRAHIIMLARREGIECFETSVTENDLLEADECFLTNAVSGLQWVIAFGNRRYYNKTAKMMTGLLNKDLFDRFSR